MYLDVKIRLSNKFWAHHLVVPSQCGWSATHTSPFRVDGRQRGSSHALLVWGINVAAANTRHGWLSGTVSEQSETITGP